MKIKVFVLTYDFMIDFPCRLNIGDIIYGDILPDVINEIILDNYGKQSNIVVSHSWFTELDGEIIQGVSTEIE